MSKHTLPARSDVDLERTWNASAVYANDADWRDDIDRLRALCTELRTYQGRLGESAQTLLDYIKLQSEAVRLFGKIRIYAMLYYSVDVTDQEAAARAGRAGRLGVALRSATSFSRPEIAAVGFDKIYQWLDENEELATYRHMLRQIEERVAHVRSAEVEQLLAEVNDPFSTAAATHGLIVNADLQFEPALATDGSEHEVAQGTIRRLKRSSDRDLRRSAWESYADGHLQFKNTLTNCLEAKFKQDAFFAQTRGYESTLHASMAPHGVPVSVFHNLIDVFKSNLPTWHRYWEIRRRVLGVDKLQQYDIRAPLSSDSPHVPYERAVEMIAAGMQPLGDEYVTVLRRGSLEERWVDVYPNRGKRQGAFSAGSPGTPPFILMSYADDIFSMSTLAHELGHSMHSYYTWRNQPIVYSRYSLFAAEVASNFNQALVRAHLLQTESDPAFQLALLEEAMSNFYRYFLVMPTLARFELAVHQQVERGEPLTADGLIDFAASLFAEAYGPAFAIDNARVGITWAQFQHLYANYYVYQYATGIAGAHALAKPIAAGDTAAAARYMEFLKAGSSLYPIDALRRAGVDLETPQPIEIAFATLADYVDRIEELVGSAEPA